jgi:hypothetical protein
MTEANPADVPSIVVRTTVRDRKVRRRVYVAAMAMARAPLTDVPTAATAASAVLAASAATATTVPSKKANPTNPLPVMQVTDIRSGKPVSLPTALSGKRPLLVWFWAPH